MYITCLKSTGFGFVTFETEEGVEKVCSEHFIYISGKQVVFADVINRDFKSCLSVSCCLFYDLPDFCWLFFILRGNEEV